MAADENSTGSVDRQQFMALWKDFKTRVDEEEETEEEIKEAFKDYDTNGDGYITKDEMIQVRDDMGKCWAKPDARCAMPHTSAREGVQVIRKEKDLDFTPSMCTCVTRDETEHDFFD